MTEQELLNSGWKKEVLCLHIQEYDELFKNKFRRLSYELDRSYSQDQISGLQRWAQEINRRFPHIKMFITGTGYIKEDAEEKTLDLENADIDGND